MKWDDIKRYFLLSHLTYQSKYADSFIGIFWIPLSSFFLIFVLTLIFSSTHDGMIEYAAYISVGYILWGFISDSLNNHSDIFRTKRNDINSPGTRIVHVLIKALVDRVYLLVLNLLFLSFTFIFAFQLELHRVLVLCVGLIALLVTSLLVTFVLSYVNLYLPDVKRIVSNITRVLFFASPVFWKVGEGAARSYFYTFNPVTYFLEIVRYGFGIEIGMPVVFAVEVVAFIILALTLLSLFFARNTPRYFKNIQ